MTLAGHIILISAYAIGWACGYWAGGGLRRRPTLPAMTITGGSRSRLFRSDRKRRANLGLVQR